MPKRTSAEVTVAAGDVSITIPLTTGDDPIKIARAATKMAARLVTCLPNPSADADSTGETLQFGFTTDRAPEFSDTRFDWATEESED